MGDTTTQTDRDAALAAVDRQTRGDMMTQLKRRDGTTIHEGEGMLRDVLLDAHHVGLCLRGCRSAGSRSAGSRALSLTRPAARGDTGHRAGQTSNREADDGNATPHHAAP